MLVITEKEDTRNSPCCVTCITKAGPIDLMICAQCRGNIRIFYCCPDCEGESEFTAYELPDFCDCGYFWPDLNFLKEQQDARVEFHLEEL